MFDLYLLSPNKIPTRTQINQRCIRRQHSSHAVWMRIRHTDNAAASVEQIKLKTDQQGHLKNNRNFGCVDGFGDSGALTTNTSPI